MTMIAVVLVAIGIFDRTVPPEFYTRGYSWRQYFGFPLLFVQPHESAWFDSQFQRFVFRPTALVIDLIVWAALLTGTAWTVERWCRKCGFRLQLSVGLLLSFVASFACWLAYRFPESALDVANYFSQDFGASLAMAGVFCFWLFLFDLIGFAWIWIARSAQRQLRRH